MYNVPSKHINFECLFLRKWRTLGVEVDQFRPSSHDLEDNYLLAQHSTTQHSKQLLLLVRGTCKNTVNLSFELSIHVVRTLSRSGIVNIN